MQRTRPDSLDFQDILYAQCPGCGYEQTPENVREMAQKVVDEMKAKRLAKKKGK